MLIKPELEYTALLGDKIDHLIASPHINTRSVKNKVEKKFWKHASNVVCGVSGGAGAGYM